MIKDVSIFSVLNLEGSLLLGKPVGIDSMIPPPQNIWILKKTAKKLPIWNHCAQNPQNPKKLARLRQPWQSRMSGQDLCEHLRWMMQRHCPEQIYPLVLF